MPNFCGNVFLCPAIVIERAATVNLSDFGIQIITAANMNGNRLTAVYLRFISFQHRVFFQIAKLKRLTNCLCNICKIFLGLKITFKKRRISAQNLRIKIGVSLPVGQAFSSKQLSADLMRKL